MLTLYTLWTFSVLHTPLAPEFKLLQGTSPGPRIVRIVWENGKSFLEMGMEAADEKKGEKIGTSLAPFSAQSQKGLSLWEKKTWSRSLGNGRRRTRNGKGKEEFQNGTFNPIVWLVTFVSLKSGERSAFTCGNNPLVLACRGEWAPYNKGERGRE